MILDQLKQLNVITQFICLINMCFELSSFKRVVSSIEVEIRKRQIYTT